MSIVKLANINMSYGDKQVLHSVNLDIEANKITCLFGKSGSGKTTVLRLIAGLETPESGEIIIGNRVVSKNGKILVSPRKRNTGFIFQDLALWPHFTVFENIAFGLKERKEKNIKEKVYKALEFSGLTEHAKKYPHQLSGGQKQLVAISRSLVLKPEILLMDEPLSGLDNILKIKILEYIKNLKDNFNITIVYVTHDQGIAFSFPERIILLSDGVITDSGTPEEIGRKNRGISDNYFREFD